MAEAWAGRLPGWEPPDEVLGVPVRGRRVRLEKLAPWHLPALHQAMTRESTLGGWPLLGERVPAREFGPYLWSLGRVHFAVVRLDTGEPIGLVQGIDDDMRSGSTGVGLFVDPRLWKAGWPLEGVLLFIDYLFCGLGFRKVSMILPDSVLAQVNPSTVGWTTREYSLRDHIRSGESYEDVHVIALMRGAWDSAVVRRLTGNAPVQAPSISPAQRSTDESHED